MLNVHLLIIDPQNDFCKQEKPMPNDNDLERLLILHNLLGRIEHPAGALSIPGADQDMDRLATFINRCQMKLADIHVTLDTHHQLDVAHPMFWRDSTGNMPPIFTIITHDDVANRIWVPKFPNFYDSKGMDQMYPGQGRIGMFEYTKKLEENGRYPLCIWPPHCLIGSPGHNVYPSVYDALTEWERKRFGFVNFVTKGSNMFTEHYSGVQADVPDPSDPSTDLNMGLIQTLEDGADLIAIAGEADTHCLANTVRDIANAFGPDSVKKMVFLEDAASSVPGFETFKDDFLHDMIAMGMQVSNTIDFLK